METPVEFSRSESQLEAILMSHPAVRDCAVLTRTTSTGQRERVAYVVSVGPFQPERLREHIHTMSALLPIDYFVPLYSIPRDVEGRADAKALAAIQVIDSDLISQCEATIRASGVAEVAVVARTVQDRLPPLHLSDLLADWKPGIADGIADSKTDTSFRQPLAAHREYTPMALADGGPLHIPANAPRTLTQALIRTAATCNGKGVTYIQADGTEISQSYSQLLEDAKCVLRGLQENGLKPHDRVILQIESLKDHFTNFWACVLGGITPVTVAVAPSYREANGVVNKLFNTWKLLEQPVIIASDMLVEPIGGVSKFLPMSGMRILRSGSMKSATPSSAIYDSKPEDLVFFQLTSGSTGIPKCIQETHRGIISHIHGAQQFNNYTPEDVDLNWLPVDHVVPILTVHLKNVYLGCRQVQIKTELVLTKPLKWLDYLESQQATHTWSPNFGFKLVCDALAKAPEKKWDLSRMKFFMNAGEQVTLPVVRNFLQGLAPFGVTPTTMQPAFGMAECCTCMTYQNSFDVESGVHRVAKSSLGGPLKRAESEADGISFVDLGPPVPGVAIRITDSQNKLVEEGIIGRFQIKGDVVTPGYLNNDAANREAFVGDGWFNSGDLGFILNGRLTLTGREKEMIIIRGANFYCYEIEDVVNRIDGAEPTFTAACAVADPSTGTEGLAVFFVPKSPEGDGLADLVRTVRARVTAEMGIAPAFVIPLVRKDFPKTTSGKIQRSALKKTLESGGFKDVMKDLDIRLETSNTLPDWFFKRTWQRQLPGPAGTQTASHRYLIFGDESGLAIRTATLLRKDGHSCVLVEAATTFSQPAPQHFRLDPKNASHYRELLESLAAQHSLPERVLHFWSYSPFNEALNVDDLNAALDRGTYSVLFLAQALAHKLGPKHPARLMVISNHTQSVLPSDVISCEKSPLLGLIRTLPQEMPWLECAHIDISGEEESAETARVLCELNLVRLEPEVAWRSGLRFVPRLERVSFTRRDKKPLPFKRGGRYLITGGLGGIGSEVARYLLTTYSANVLLLGRTPLPERGTWESHRGKNDTVSTRIQTLSGLEKLPGHVDYAAAEISNPAEVRSVVAEAESRWGGRLDGVIHLAGVFEEKLLVEETRDSFESVLRPKALGALALAEVLNDRPECFVVLFSSVNSLFGGATVGAYAAANSFLDGFAFARSKQHPTTTYCLAWSPWDETGMSRGYALKSVSRARGYYFISARQGIDSMLAALHSGETQLIVGLDGSNDNIRQRGASSELHVQRLVACIQKNSEVPQVPVPSVYDRFGVPGVCRFESLDVLPKTQEGKIDRAFLAAGSGTRSVSSDPSTETERRIATIWRDALAVAHVGIADNFFELGGHSLLAAQILFRLQEEFKVELSLRDLFEAPTIQALAARIDGAEKCKGSGSWPQIEPKRERNFEPFKLTEIQQAYWVGRTSVFELGNVGCHIYTEVEFAELDMPRFNLALQRLIQRHPMLRSIIRPDGTQCVLKDVPPYVVRVNDLRGTSSDNVAVQLESVRASMSHQVLDTSRAPLFEIRASQMDERVRLHVSIDLLIADARSFQILIEDISRLYENPEQPLPELELTFRDYVEAADLLESRDEFNRSRDYWLKRLNTLPPAPDLPLAANSETLRTPRFVRRQVRLEPERWQKLKERAARAGLTPAGVLMGVYAEILSIWSKRPRFSLNLTLFNRLPLHPQVNEVVGDFTSVTLLEVERDAKKCFEERCRRMQEQLWDDLNHRFFSGVQVMREMARSQAGMPAAAMPVVFTSILDLPSGREQSTSLLKHANFVYGISQTPQVWLDNQVYQDGETLVCNWDAVEGLFPGGLLDDMFSAYQRMLQDLASDGALWSASHAEVAQKSIPDSQAALRHSVNDTAAPVSSRLLHTLFTEQAAATPEKTAIICGSRSVSFAELDARSNQIARQLRQAGAKPNTLVAIVCEKSCEQVTAALSILKSGAAYLPIDPDVPNERLRYLLKHGEVQFALTMGKLVDRLNWPEGITRIRVDEPAAIDGDSDPLDPVQTPLDLAYVIYTSGSTGNPKGVVIDHRGAVNTVLDINSRFGIGREDKIFGISQLTFDLSVYDIFGTLAAGGTLVLPEASRTRDPMHWAELVEQHGITVWNSVPALVNVLIDQAGERRNLSSLRVVMMSGDWIPVALPDRIRGSAPNARVFSLGGATEASIWSILYPIEKVDAAWKSIPYGKPMLNQSFHVLNEKLSLCPDWVPGNLYIGGIGLAKGYWRDEEKTRGSFITHPATGERLYRTGDLGRYLPDGNIEFLGREDFQVKVNGFRIELGEIETVLEKHPSVRTAVVIAAGSGDNRRLVAYIVPQPNMNAEAENLRSYLKQKLPEYMIPLSYVAMESLPLTSNGKVDRRALPDSEVPKRARKSEYLAPRTPLEEVLTGIVAEILNLDRVGIFDNFFELGGNSLLVIQVASRIRDVLDVEIAANALFDSSTVARLAAQMLLDPEQREKIEQSAEVLLSVADVPESDVDAWLSQSSYI